jgi:opacity protein-like surface antigen
MSNFSQTVIFVRLRSAFLMRHQTYLLAILFVTLALNADAQRWKRYRHEAWGGFGGTNFLGELGGGQTEARDLFLDFDAKSSRYVLMGGYRYKLNEITSVRGSLAYGRLYGSDRFSGDIHRFSRNLTFRSPLIELAAVGELYFIREKTSNRYRVRGIRGALGSGFSAYINAGLGGFFFNPKAQYPGDGKWYALQPIGTEGQGFPGQPKKYSRVQMCIPMGIGAKYSINRNLALTLEYSFRFTFTDYMDDVSTDYYDPVAIANANGGVGTTSGDAAAYLSNPAFLVIKDDGTEFIAGGKVPWQVPVQQRGDKTTNDTYMFAVLALNYKFTSKKANRPKF